MDFKPVYEQFGRPSLHLYIQIISRRYRLFLIQLSLAPVYRNALVPGSSSSIAQDSEEIQSL